MIKLKIKIISLLLVLIMINLTGCGVVNSSDNTNSGIFRVGDNYLFVGEFGTQTNAGIVYGSLFVEVLEISDDWIRIEVLDHFFTDHFLRSNNLAWNKEEGDYRDLWLNKNKIISVYTDVDELFRF